jgi:hypothetical protein
MYYVKISWIDYYFHIAYSQQKKVFSKVGKNIVENILISVTEKTLGE